MKTGPEGLALIKAFEGLRLDAYDDGTGVLTIGYGHTTGVRRGQRITAADADVFLRDDLRSAELAVSTAVRAPLNQNQFDALVSLAFNIGSAAFRGSTLVEKLNAGAYADVPAQFERWNHAGGKVLAGLTRRRTAEAALWGKPAGASPVAVPTSQATSTPAAPATPAGEPLAGKGPWSDLLAIIAGVLRGLFVRG